MVCSDNMDVLISLISPNTTSADRQWRLAVAGETSGHWRIGFFFFFFSPVTVNRNTVFFHFYKDILWAHNVWDFFFFFKLQKHSFLKGGVSPAAI